MKKKTLELYIRFYVLFQNKKGEILVSNMGYTIMSTVAIFGFSVLLFAWLQGWFSNFEEGVKNSGKNNRFGSVTWL